MKHLVQNFHEYQGTKLGCYIVRNKQPEENQPRNEIVFLAETSLSSLPTLQVICCWDHREKRGQGCHRTKAFQQVLARRSHFPSLCHLPLLTAAFQVSHGCIYLAQSRTLAHSLENAVPTESNNWFLGESGKGGLSLFSLYRAGTHSRQCWK